MKQEHALKNLLTIAREEPINNDFKDIVMRKVEFSYQLKLIRTKNIRLAWICLLASAILFPIALLLFSKMGSLSLIQKLGFTMESISSILMPASVLITAIIILLQIDNLLRLSFQPRQLH